MQDTNVSKRTDTSSAMIRSSPHSIYKAFLNPEAVAQWRPPKGMKCRIYEFNPQAGGFFRMSYGYGDKNHEVPGKTSEHEDIFHGRFLELIPNKRIVELIEFESEDPAFAGEMKITTTLVPVPGGSTEVSFRCENVPVGIRPDDHNKGMKSSLENLAEFTE
jgi:uncharacterized protein YndB with AHSA1/START domain